MLTPEYLQLLNPAITIHAISAPLLPRTPAPLLPFISVNPANPSQLPPPALATAAPFMLSFNYRKLSAADSRLREFIDACAYIDDALQAAWQRQATGDYERAPAIFAARLGPDHPDTRTVSNNLARLLKQINQAS